MSIILALLAVITGPTEAKPGQMVILEGGRPGSQWILPPGLEYTGGIGDEGKFGKGGLDKGKKRNVLRERGNG